VHGLRGSFVLVHSATMNRGDGALSLTVVPDSGTDELAGPRGRAQIDTQPDGGHVFTLEYDV
jgi:hypothetical protein